MEKSIWMDRRTRRHSAPGRTVLRQKSRNGAPKGDALFECGFRRLHLESETRPNAPFGAPCPSLARGEVKSPSKFWGANQTPNSRDAREQIGMRV